MEQFGHQDIVFVAAKRTPFGAFGGTLKSKSATDLGVHAAKAALAQSKIDHTHLEQVIFGNVMQTSTDAIYLARHIGLKCEIPVHVPALTVNRLCGSGFQAIISGAEQIALGLAKCVLVGGTESMSNAPHVIRGARWGLRLGDNTLEDSLWSGLYDPYAKLSMGLTAEKLAEQYKISQLEVDTYSVRSQSLTAKALHAGYFSDEIAEMEVKTGKQTASITTDEHPRPNTTLDSIKTLPKIFKPDGVVHAAAASGIADGACALVMTSGDFAQAHGLNPLGRLVHFGVCGVDPTVMGIGPVSAIQSALQRAKLTLDDVDLIEVNEAFAPQVLAVQKELGLSDDKFNIHGGAIALGHPLAASGARIATHLLYALRKNKKSLGIGSACIGGGQGIAVIIEAI